MPTTTSFKDMPVWQRSIRLVAEIYQLTARLPASERLGLSGSLQQASLTIPTDISSGTKAGRSGFRTACLSARQSCAEVETLLIIVQQVYPTIPVDDLLSEMSEITDALTAMAKRLDSPDQKRPRKTI